MGSPHLLLLLLPMVLLLLQFGVQQLALKSLGAKLDPKAINPKTQSRVRVSSAPRKNRKKIMETLVNTHTADFKTDTGCHRALNPTAL